MYGGLSILGAKAGMLSSYAISILILYIFNSKPRNILIHPFDVFHAFLIEFSNFPWDKYIYIYSTLKLYIYDIYTHVLDLL
jgi:hypothetical protein